MNTFLRMTGACKRALSRTLDDWLAVAGAGLISYGVYLIYAPAAFIVLGVFFLAGAVIWSRGTEAGHDI